jgi:D-alanyl-D-alanine carboxypeptidase
MFKLSALCTATLICLQAPYALAQQAPASTADTPLATQIDASIGSYFKADQPGATIIVTRDGKTILRKAYGMANIEQKQAMQPDTVLRLGSITKQFTAVAILMLAEQGKLSLDDDIQRHLPSFPTEGGKVTIAQLLNHTSGIHNFTSTMGYGMLMGRDYTVAGMIDRFKDDPRDFKPGQDWKYSNSGYFLLGAIIEKASGMAYADFLAENIFKPLGMNDTAYEGKERGKAPRAQGYSGDGKAFSTARYLSMTQPYAAGSLASNVDDMARWDAAISAGKLLSAASWQRAFTGSTLPNGKPTDYGAGWQLATLQGEATIGHGGGINGFSTYAVRVPASKIYVAVLTNADSGLPAPEMLASRAAALAMGKPFPDFKPIAVDGKVLDAYVGSFKIDDKNERVIKRDGDKVTMQRTGRPAVEMIPYKADGFYLPNSLVMLEFGRDAAGKVVELKVTQRGTSERSVRMP